MQYKSYLQVITNSDKHELYNFGDLRDYIFKLSLACYQNDFLKKNLKPQVVEFVNMFFHTSGSYSIAYNMSDVRNLTINDLCFFQSIVDIVCLFILQKDYKNITADNISAINQSDLEKYIYIPSDKNSTTKLTSKDLNVRFFENKFQLKYLFDNFYEKI